MTGKVRRPGLLIYRDRAQAWRWRIRSQNGQVVAGCAEGNGYTTRQAARHGALVTFRWLLTAAAKGQLG